jgi:hypothetical protein
VKTNGACFAAIAASVALGLTGCAGDSRAADPKVTTPAGSAATATSAPGPAPTRTASAATTTPPGQSSLRASEEAAAIALVRTYVDEYNKALQSGSTTAFRETFKESCPLCLGDANRLDEVFKKNQRIHGLRSAVASPIVTFSGVAHGGPQIWVEGQLSQAGGQVLAASGAVVHNITPTPAFRVLWEVKAGTSPVIVASEIR